MISKFIPKMKKKRKKRKDNLLYIIMYDKERIQKWNEMGFRVQKAKRYMGVEKYIVMVSKFPWMVECNSFHEIESNIGLMVRLKERQNTP